MLADDWNIDGRRLAIRESDNSHPWRLPVFPTTGTATQATPPTCRTGPSICIALARCAHLLPSSVRGFDRYVPIANSEYTS